MDYKFIQNPFIRANFLMKKKWRLKIQSSKYWSQNLKNFLKVTKMGRKITHTF